MGIFLKLLTSAAGGSSYQQDLQSIVNVLSGAVIAGLVVRIIICSIKMSHEENTEVHKKSIKHCIIAAIITICLTDIYYILSYYFNFGVLI